MDRMSLIKIKLSYPSRLPLQGQWRSSMPSLVRLGSKRVSVAVDLPIHTNYPQSRSNFSSSNVESKAFDRKEARQLRAIQALHLKPLKRDTQYGIPTCDLQLRSFSVQPLEFFADFALRAAYFLGLPAFGPIPLPRLTERWTVPKSHFIFKKAQENFERVTLRRFIQIKDGNADTVQLWLAYLRKNQMYGVGMKANVWEFGNRGQDISKRDAEQNAEPLDSVWPHLGQVTTLGAYEKVEELLSSRRFKEAAGLRQPLQQRSIE